MSNTMEPADHVTIIDGHRIKFWLRGDDAPAELDDASVEHLKRLLKDDYREGELYVAVGEAEFRGWWSLDVDSALETKAQEQNAPILCLFEIDPDTREATGTVVPFCSEHCRHEAKSSLDFPDHTEGISDVNDFGFTPYCVQCSIEISRDSQSAGKRSVTAADAALQAHAQALGIEGGADIQVWQLLASLLEYCAAHGVDFDKELADVKANVISGNVDLPASAKAMRK